MRIREIEAKSILLKRKYIDSWFVSRYGMNLYRGCQHNCAYYDGRAEGYYVEGEFGRDVGVKINAPEILRRELDLLQQINRQRRALVCFSISSVDERISRIFEPGVPSPRERLETLGYFKARGIPCGLFLLPVIPYVTDRIEVLEEALRQATAEYYRRLHERFWEIAAKYEIALRMPPELYSDLLDDRDRIVVMLEQRGYLFRLRGKISAYGYAARAVARWEGPISDLREKQIPGISGKAGALIREILSTGSAKEYEQLLYSTGVSSEFPHSTQDPS